MKGLLTVLLLFFVTSLLGQGFTYSYVDPCSKKLKTLYVNNNQSVTINYLGQTNSFTQQDFTSGAFDNWISTVQSQASSSPCDEVMTYQQTFQNMVVTQNLISTLTSVTATSTMNMSNALGNSVNNSSNNSESKRKDKQQNKNNGTTISNNSPSGNIQNSSTSQSGTVNSGGNQNSSQSTSGGSNSSGETNSQNAGNSSNTTNPSQGGSGQTEPPVNNPSSNPPSSNTGSGTQSGANTGQGGGGNTQSGTNGSQGQNVPDETKKETGGGVGGTTNSVSNASGNSKVKVGTVIGTGDIVAIRSNEDGSNQFKGTMSLTKANTNNTLAKGALLTFTTSINNSNLTLYGAFTNKKKTNVLIVANSSMLDFDKNFFNTTTALESKKFGKVSVMAGANFTVGGLYGEPFSNLSAVGGGFVPFQVNKKINGNILLLGVYSPFTKFYEGKWWNSGLLLVPFSSWDYTISKSFKYNISFSGTYELKGSVLQYQILTGGKILL